MVKILGDPPRNQNRTDPFIMGSTTGWRYWVWMRDCGCCLSLNSNISSCGFFAGNRVLIVEEENLHFDSITEYAWKIVLTHEISSVRLELHFTYLFGKCKKFGDSLLWKLVTKYITVWHMCIRWWPSGKFPDILKQWPLRRVHSCTWLTWLQTPQSYQPTHCRKARALERLAIAPAPRIAPIGTIKSPPTRGQEFF